MGGQVEHPGPTLQLRQAHPDEEPEHPAQAPLFLYPQVDQAVVGQPPTGLLQGPPGLRLAGEPLGKELSQRLLSPPPRPAPPAAGGPLPPPGPGGSPGGSPPPPAPPPPPWRQRADRGTRASRSDGFPSKSRGIPPVSAQTGFTTHRWRSGRWSRLQPWVRRMAPTASPRPSRPWTWKLVEGPYREGKGLAGRSRNTSVTRLSSIRPTRSSSGVTPGPRSSSVGLPWKKWPKR